MTFEFIEQDEPLYIDDFWFDVCETDGVDFEKILQLKLQREAVVDAIMLLRELKNQMEINDLIST